ncbi:unnamed protein product [Calypogeia fissa]
MASEREITFSFHPGEVITAGEVIELRAPRHVDPKSAQSVVTLTQHRREVNIVVTVADNVVQIPTEQLSGGGYDILVGELLDTDNVRMNEFLVTPLIIRAPIGSVHSNLRIHHSACVAIGDTSTVKLQPGQKHPPGTSFVEFIKGTDSEHGRPVNIAIDQNGKSVDGEKLLADVSRRRFQKFGRLHETLWSHVQQIGDQERVDIVVWPSIKTFVASPKTVTRDASVLSPEEIQFREEILAMKSAITSNLRKLRAKTIDGDSLHIPSVSATVLAIHVHSIAKWDEVGVVLLDDKSAMNDLGNSEAIAQSDVVHSKLKVTGKGVNVAVFEDGPNETRDLDFEGRYDDQPPESDHARLTSAIIKNVEEGGPYGHAPGCNLYSANRTYKNRALTWAVYSEGCSVISQSFHRRCQPNSGNLEADDMLKDFMVHHWPHPTIVQAAGNFWKGDSNLVDPPSDEYVNHKGYSTLTIGSHDDNALGMDGSSTYRNPISPHADRELPELVANGTAVSALSLTMTGTSFAAAAVAGAVALIQEVDHSLKYQPEACRAILFASANRRVVGGTGWSDVESLKSDSKAGAGALDAYAAVQIAQNHLLPNKEGEIKPGFAWGILDDSAFDDSDLSLVRYYVLAPKQSLVRLPRLQVKVALAWNSKITQDSEGQLSSVLTVDLDLEVYDNRGNLVAVSASYDNSYEVAEFNASPNETYSIAIRCYSKDKATRYGVAWTFTETSWLHDGPGGYVVVGDGSKTTNTVSATSKVLGAPNAHRSVVVGEGSKTTNTVSATSKVLRAPNAHRSIMMGDYETNIDCSKGWIGGKNSAILSFSGFDGESANSIPIVVTGLSMLDIRNTELNDQTIERYDKTKVIKCVADEVSRDQFSIHFNFWPDTTLYNAKASWLRLASATSSGILAGMCNVTEAMEQVTRTVQFGTTFPERPKVFVGLSGFRYGRTSFVDLYLVAARCDAFDFHLSLSPFSSTEVMWIAFPPDFDVRIGEYRSSGSYVGGLGSIDFHPAFPRTPEVFTALTHLQVAQNNFSVRLNAKAASESRMDWSIEQSGGAYGGKAGYFALCV